MFPAIYVSADALERADAYRFGYRTVCQYPREIGVPDLSETLVLDFNHVLFDDHELAVRRLNAAAHRGLLVGVHTYYPQALPALRLAMLPNVLVAKTHRQLLHKLGRCARLSGRQWQLDAMASLLAEHETGGGVPHAE